MRTTVTFSPATLEMIKTELRRTGRSFKEVVNGLIQDGFNHRKQEHKPKSFVIHARDMALRPGIDLSNIGRLLEEVEGPWHK